MNCPICDGLPIFLGTLGSLDHFSCRNCGMGFSSPVIQPEVYEDASIDPPDPNTDRESMYFEIFARRDPTVGIKDVYEKVSFESGLVFENTEDLEETRQQLTKAFTEIYGGFVPVILFDFEPHDYYKPNGGDFAKDFIDVPEEHKDQWFAVVAVERGPNGRELAINKPDTLSTAIDLAEEYDNRANHGYEKILVRRQPDGEIVWSSLEQD